MLTNFLLYIQERFPIIPVLLFAFGYATLANGVSYELNIWLLDVKQALRTILLFSTIFLFFLLRQRVTDEFKDSEHDLKNFPDRPVPSGLITKEQLILLGIFALTCEWLSVYLLGPRTVYFYLPVFLYSLLMAKEFFIPKWLNRHFNLYFLSHEAIFLLFGLFFILVVNATNFSATGNLPAQLVALSAAPMSIEIIRKFSPRYDKKGKPVADTYSTVWGRRVALLVLVILLISTGLFLTLIKNNYQPLIISGLTSLVILTFGQKSDKVVVTTGAVNFLGLAILTNIIW